MAKDFAQPYRNVPYFGIWADETADDFGRRDACAVIRDAVMRCYDEDMRTPDLSAALDYLTAHGVKDGIARSFRAALDTPDPAARLIAARAVYDALGRALKG